MPVSRYLSAIKDTRASTIGKWEIGAQRPSGTEVYAANEREPLLTRLAPVNDWLGKEVVRFLRY